MSWPTMFAAALAMWLVLRGPAAKRPSWVQKTCRTAMVFFVYSGTLYLLKWNLFWKLMPSMDFEQRNKAEGFLLMISTLVWFIATLRILFRGVRLPGVHAGSGGHKNRPPQKGKGRRSLSLTDLVLFYLFIRK
ncbi:MAG: hypothetical protein WCB12_21885 [Bryobacteraceae bacterium]